jgi:hypothetical protein
VNDDDDNVRPLRRRPLRRRPSHPTTSAHDRMSQTGRDQLEAAMDMIEEAVVRDFGPDTQVEVNIIPPNDERFGLMNEARASRGPAGDW